MRMTYPSRLASRCDAAAAADGGGYDCDDGLSSDEDPRLSSLKEHAGGVRDLAINDWARSSISIPATALRANYPPSFLLFTRDP